MRQAKAWDPSRLFTAASGWVDPQDATSGGGWRYSHYSGYVRAPWDAGHYHALPLQRLQSSRMHAKDGSP